MKNSPAPKPISRFGKPERRVHLQLGEADINPVQIRDEVAHDKERQQPPHDLADRSLLDFIHGGPLPGFIARALSPDQWLAAPSAPIPV